MGIWGMIGLVVLLGCTKADRHAAAPAPVPPMPLPPITHPAPTPEPPPDPAAWFALPEGKLIAAAAERALYEAPGQTHFYVHFRVNNRTQRGVGIDLRRYFGVRYANQWGWDSQRERGALEEI